MKEVNVISQFKVENPSLRMETNILERRKPWHCHFYNRKYNFKNRKYNFKNRTSKMWPSLKPIPRCCCRSRRSGIPCRRCWGHLKNKKSFFKQIYLSNNYRILQVIIVMITRKYFAVRCQKENNSRNRTHFLKRTTNYPLHIILNDLLNQ